VRFHAAQDTPPEWPFWWALVPDAKRHGLFGGERVWDLPTPDADFSPLIVGHFLKLAPRFGFVWTGGRGYHFFPFFGPSLPRGGTAFPRLPRHNARMSFEVGPNISAIILSPNFGFVPEVSVGGGPSPEQLFLAAGGGSCWSCRCDAELSLP
jgi:hypothetical protein